jgi:hypothetical protein
MTMSEQPFCACGVPRSSSAPRCGSCPQRQQAAGPSTFGAAGPSTLGAATALTRPVIAGNTADGSALMRYSRWQKSTGTFGPTGRVIATLLLLVPLPLLAMAATVGIGIIGAGIYVLVIMPWALRDIWKKAAIPIDAPAPTASASRF